MLCERIGITSVLKGSCSIQGPVDDLGLHLQGTDSDEKKFMFPENHIAVGIESGTCSVCSAPCSLCMHYKSESGFSCNLSVRTEADSYSVIVVDSMPICKNIICDELQPAISETSNLLSTCSSHDSYSENAKSRTSLRASVAYDSSDDVDIPQVFCSAEVVEGEQSLKRNPDLDQFSLHGDIHLRHRFPSGKGDVKSGLEFHGDVSLCTSEARDPNIVVSDCIADIVKIGGECSNMLISNFVDVNNNVVPAEARDDNQRHEIGESHCTSKRSNATVDSSLLHSTYNSASVNNISYVKSQHPPCITEISPNCFPLSSHSQDGNSTLFKGESMGIEGNFNLHPQAKFNKCTEVDNVDSSSIIVGNSPESKSSTIPYHEASTESRTESGYGTSNINDLCLDTKLGTDCKKASDSCSEDRHVNDLLERDGAVLDADKGEDQHVQPQASTVAENYEPDATLHDVKVCDICGDAGREDLLAICSWCSDGAEHTYCMREKLDKVPEGEWLCEECKIKEMENQNVNECEALYGRSKSTYLNDINQNSMNTLIQKKPQKLEKPAFSCQFSLKNQDMGKEVKTASMETPSEVQPAKGSESFSRSKTYLSSCSFKGLPPLYSPHGKFSRSVSFSNSKVNPKVKTLIESAPPTKKITREPAANDLKKGLSKFSTNTTFKNTTLGCSNTELSSKYPSLQPSLIESLKALKEVKERNAVEKKIFSEKKNSFVRPSAAITSNYYPLKVDAKSGQSDGKMYSVSKANVHSFSQGLDADNLGPNYDADNPKGSKVAKEGIQRSISSLDSSYRKVEIVSPRVAVQSFDSGHKGNITRDSTILIGSSFSALGGNRPSHSQKGNETERVTQLCSTDKLGVSAPKSSVEQNLRAVEKRGNKWREVVDAAMSRSVLKSEKLDTFEELQAVRDIPTAITETSPLLVKPLSGSAVPKLECIWRGSFNVIGTGSPPKMFFGIQAHLSTCASHGVFQLATKVPGNVQLEEVSGINSWPLQLLPTGGPKEENIALFFFANDIESYEKSYRKLMDKMHINDLALRGNIDGTELLIFTSNKLPMYSQRWNRMHYLWGLFRGKRRYCLSADPKVPQEQPSVPVMSSSETKAEALRVIIDTPNSRLQMPTPKLCSEEKNDGDCQENLVTDCAGRKADDSPALTYEIGVQSCLRKESSSVLSVSSNCNKGSDCTNIEGKNGEKKTSSSSVVLLGADLLNSQSTDNRKRGRSCSIESAETSNNTVETATALLRDRPPSWLPVEDDREQKKTYNIIDDNICARLSSKVHPLYSVISAPRSSRTAEMCFFPINNTESSNIIHIPCSDEDTCESSTPDLELALGGKSKSTKPFTFRSLFHSVDGPSSPSGDGDDVPASLSLCL